MSNLDYIDISDITLEKSRDYQEISAIVDGDRIWFRFPLFLELEPRAELFMAPAMIESMVRAIPVRVTDDIAISHKLARTFEEIQAVLKTWNDDFTISPILAKTRKHFPETENVISCFSGGIDSAFTYGHYRDDISHLLLVQGFEDWKNNKNWEKNVAARQTFAHAQDKELIAVETNVRPYYEDRKINHELIHGALLASIAISLNPKLFLIPSSYTYDALHPWGSHPLLDPLWGTETTGIIHHGCATSRPKKTEYIAQQDDLLHQIQVCRKSSFHNCGECSKCVRTALALKILGKCSDNLPEANCKAQYDLLTINDDDGLFFVEELIEFYKKDQNNDITKYLTQYVRTYKTKKTFHNIFKILFGKMARKLSRGFSKNDWYNTRATLTSNKIK